MNILRGISVDDSEGTLVDLEYIIKKDKSIMASDMRIYSIIDNKVGNLMNDVNIVDKLLIARELIRFLETSNE